MAHSKEQKGIFFGFLSALGFATYLLINRHVYTTYQVNTFNYVATFLLWGGFFGLSGFLINRSKKNYQVEYKNMLPVVVNGTIAGAAMALLVFGQRYTTAVNASILAVSTIITTVIFSKILLRESFNRLQYVWLLVMFTGLYIAIVGFHYLHLNKGDAIILGSIVLFGFTNAYSKLLMKNTSSDFVAAGRLISGGLLLTILALILKGPQFLVTSAGLWPIIAGLFFWLTIKFFYASIDLINPNRAIVLANTHPMITPIAGVVLLSEPYGWSKFFGSVLMLFSIYFINKK